MPTCNLAETVHNKWLQQSGKRGTDSYVATVDDFVRAFMQMVRYYQYLKGTMQEQVLERKNCYCELPNAQLNELEIQELSLKLYQAFPEWQNSLIESHTLRVKKCLARREGRETWH